MQGFWQRQKDKEGKIHQTNWQLMSKTKLKGDLGFRDLEDFNLAMLAKQCWRLIQNPHSLAARVLSLKYYPKGDFHKAQWGKRPSLLWRSFLATKPLLEEGLIWRVGIGKSIKIQLDKRLPQPSSCKVQSKVNLFHVNEKVAILIDHDTKQWYMARVSSTFSQEEANLISKIPISQCGSADKLIWKGTTNGIFSVRSAYYLQREIRDNLRGQTSRNINQEENQSQLWKLFVPKFIETFPLEGLS